jgi:hypothetical protein
MKKTFNGACRSVISPTEYYSVSSVADLRRVVLVITGGLLFLGAILIFLAAASNAEEIRNASESYLLSGGIDPDDLPVDLKPQAPWALLLFPFYWIVLLLFVGIVRYSAIIVFGEQNRSFQRVLLIAGHSFIPVISIGIIIGVFTQIFPIEPASSKTVGVPALRVLMIGAAVLIVLFWEGLITFRAYIISFEQYAGRAILTAVAPWFSMFLLLLLSFFVG